MTAKRFLVIIYSLLIFMTNNAFSTDAIDFEVTADYVSKYIWRGQNISDDPVFQPGLSASYKGLTAAIWGNLETTSINNNNGEFTEWDYSLDYSGELPGIKGIGYSIGLINYHFPSVVSDTTEFYWGLNFDLPLNPSITVYHDIDEVKGTYASFGLSHSIDKIAELGLDSPVGMEVAAGLGWGSSGYNECYWGVDESKLNDLTFSISFPVEIGGWILAPSLSYMKLVEGNIRSGSDGDALFAGISLSKSF